MSVPATFAIDGVSQHYAWGSTTAIPELLGFAPDGRPYAELWFGAHTSAPSPAPQLGRTLAELIDADPGGLLGPSLARRYEGRLPFLLKTLAAQQSLSIQVHPTRAQAKAGYAAEEAAGLARESGQRNYRDANHKPELLCAITPFEALCGFRPRAQTDRLLAALDLAELDTLRTVLSGRDGLRAAFTYLLTLPDPAPLVRALTTRAAQLDGGEWASTARAIGLAAADFPADVGVALALLLNHVQLQPGEAIYLPAGNVHAYLRGTGVEIMASSDNVLRCGLTGKHIDVAELCKVADFTELAQPRWPALSRCEHRHSREREIPPGAPVQQHFQVPVPDFALARLELSAAAPADVVCGPSIVLCTEGEVVVEAGTGDPAIALRPGRAAFITAAATECTLHGTGTVFLAGPGQHESRER